jgi:hypothetical protein
MRCVCVGCIKVWSSIHPTWLGLFAGGCGLVGGVDGEEEDEGLGRVDEKEEKRKRKRKRKVWVAWRKRGKRGKEEEEEVGLGRVEAGGSYLGGVVGGGRSSVSPDSARSSQACADTQAPT